LHGNPGAPAELALLGGDAVRSWFAPDRAALPLEPEARIMRLTAMIAEGCGDEPIRLIGFSAGAYVALQVAARMPGRPLALHLVSPAGPLETGDYLGAMAGGPVFGAAMNHPRRFAALVWAQSVCAQRFPGLLTRFLFAAAQGEDRLLKADEQFTHSYRDVLQTCLGAGRASYKAEIESYVLPWAGLLPAVKHPVTIWQGSCDNWTPPEMAKTLALLLPNVQALHMLEGQSHFSALRTALAALA
jgi:pimeloyl-ACP methyl ester carboxylesterase